MVNITPAYLCRRKDACQAKQKFKSADQTKNFKADVDKAKSLGEVVSAAPGKQGLEERGRMVKGKSRE
jgi:hypothetical protein